MIISGASILCFATPIVRWWTGWAGLGWARLIDLVHVLQKTCVFFLLLPDCDRFCFSLFVCSTFACAHYPLVSIHFGATHNLFVFVFSTKTAIFLSLSLFLCVCLYIIICKMGAGINFKAFTYTLLDAVEVLLGAGYFHSTFNYNNLNLTLFIQFITNVCWVIYNYLITCKGNADRAV